MIEKLLKDFIEELNKDDKYKLIPAGKPSSENYNCNIYNEISLQHMLGKFLEENPIKRRKKISHFKKT